MPKQRARDRVWKSERAGCVVDRCKNCCILLMAAALRCRMPCILFSCVAERMNNWFPLPKSRAVFLALPLPFAHALALLPSHTTVVSHSFVSWFRPPRPARLHKRASVYSSIRLFVCVLVALFICLSLSSHATYFRLVRRSAPPSKPLARLFSASIVFSGCRLSVYFRSFHLRVLLSLIPIPKRPFAHFDHSSVRPFSPFSYFAIFALSLALLSLLSCCYYWHMFCPARVFRL